MGETLRVVIRDKEGVVHKFERHTSIFALGYMFQRVDLALNPDKILSEYIERIDYSPVKGLLAPISGGLVVIDRIHNMILSNQSMVCLSVVTTAMIAVDLNLLFTFDPKAESSPVPFVNENEIKRGVELQNKFSNYIGHTNLSEEIDDYRVYYENFLMGNYSIRKKDLEQLEKQLDNPEIKEYYDQLVAFDEVLSRPKRGKADWLDFLVLCQKKHPARMNFNLEPFTYIDYNQSNYSDSEAIMAFYEKLNELGFILTKEEEKIWGRRMRGEKNEEH